ncbi:hypothetical protein [Rhodococcoides yunnanense]|uniref:hypothetical protein n=1 Tax=Rhodococcoides yunnanense TaxID=278209 RepID=UPI0009354970|nr:hypothetical protein [Rhodococcus yunnanensis]
MDEHAPPRSHDTLMTVFVITSIVAAGIVVAGLTATPEEPELTVQPATSTEAPPPAQEEYVVVTPEVDYPSTIPGCDSVEEPIEDRYFSFIGDGSASYDNPAAPWFSGPKAQLMSTALSAALPSDVEFEDGQIPYFDPIPVYDDTAGQPSIESTSALATLSREGKSGFVSLGVSQRDEGVPSCVAGTLDERTTLPDGTVVDTDDSWREVNDERTSTRSATAYRTDGSWVSAYSSAPGDEDALPLTLDELVRVVTDPALATSVAPPPGTPGNSAECGSASAFSSSQSSGETQPFTVAEIEALDSALLRADTGALLPSPPLGALRTSTWGGGLCQVVNSAAGPLTIAIDRGAASDPGLFGSGGFASVATPSGLGITIVTENPWDPAALERVALTPGLDLP